MVKGHSEESRMIFDSEEAFPNSVVVYVRFIGYPTRQVFAYLREKELMLQDDLRRYAEQNIPDEDREINRIRIAETKIRLQEVEAHLIWMVSNLPVKTPKETRQMELL